VANFYSDLAEDLCAFHPTDRFQATVFAIPPPPIREIVGPSSSFSFFCLASRLNFRQAFPSPYERSEFMGVPAVLSALPPPPPAASPSGSLMAPGAPIAKVFLAPDHVSASVTFLESALRCDLYGPPRRPVYFWDPPFLSLRKFPDTTPR